VRADPNRPATAVGRPGSLLGVFDEAPGHVDQIQLGPGDAVLFYTDGITDLPPPYALTADELAAQVGSMAEGRADAMADRVEQSLAERVSDLYRGDDVALVVLKVAGEGDGAGT
jgi:serine phosphatase RsbU (regulator of sigma subunit)